MWVGVCVCMCEWNKNLIITLPLFDNILFKCCNFLNSFLSLHICLQHHLKCLSSMPHMDVFWFITGHRDCFCFLPVLWTRQKSIKRAANHILIHVTFHTPLKWNNQTKGMSIFKVFGTKLSISLLEGWIYLSPPLRAHEALNTWFLMGLVVLLGGRKWREGGDSTFLYSGVDPVPIFLCF